LNQPLQNVPESEKTEEWGIKNVKYGLSILDSREENEKSYTSLYNSYNGTRTKESELWITKSHGKESRAPFYSYKVGRGKQYLLEGEFLGRPLGATVNTINRTAMVDKMAQRDLVYGSVYAKKEIEKIKEVIGIDVMNGVKIPDSVEELKNWSPKDLQEDIMQVMLNEQMKALNVHFKLSEEFRHVRITSECWNRVDLDKNGKVFYKVFDVRDAIYEEIIGDDFLEKTPIAGGREWVPFHEVITRFDLTKDEADKIKGNSDFPNDRRVRFTNSQRQVDVVHVEWKSVRAHYYKIMPKTPAQLSYDSETKEIVKEIPADIYEKNKAKYNKGVNKGEFKIEIRYTEDLWEGTSIGRVVFKNIKRKENQQRSVDNPAYVISYSYGGALFGTTSGKRISLQALIEKFEVQFDITEYLIMKELVKAKGKAISYDLAAIPKDKSLSKVIQEFIDDGFVTYNSMATGNMGGRNADLSNMFKEFDLGFSQSFPQLLTLQNQIIASLDRITGINEMREGSIPASSTVSNAQQGLKNSRTITEPLFYQMQLHTQKTLKRIVNATKISWAFYQLEQGEQILGTDKYNYLVTKEIANRDYGIYIDDGNRYAKLKDKLDRYMEYGINSKQVSMVDALRYELAESTVAAEKALEDGFERLEKLTQQSAQEQMKANAEMQQQKLETQLQISRENREDIQTHDINKIAAQTEGQIAIDNNKMKGKMVENQIESENKIITGNY